MKKQLLLSVLLFSFLLTSCVHIQATSETSNHNAKPNVREYSVQSVLWQQNAAEYRALCYQAFNTAKMQLDAMLSKKSNAEKKLAIVTDIDETVLDNSPFNAKLIEKNEEYSQKEWDNWGKQESAKAIPGATKFLNYAKSKGVEVFYVSNRLDNQKTETLVNMKKVNFPYADKNHLLLKTNESAKQSRYDEVSKNYNILLFLGDNLSDFSNKFRAKSTDRRNKLADSLESHFGKDFIVLPNPMYGDWESKGIYQGRYDWTEAQKDSIRKADLHTY